VTATQILLIWYAVQLLFVPLWHLENALGYEKFVCLAVAVHGAGALSFLLLHLSLERMLALWVVLGVCAYGILGLAGPEIVFYLKELLRTRSAMALLLWHPTFGGLAFWVHGNETFGSPYAFTGLEIAYALVIMLISRQAITAFVGALFKRAAAPG
ncbi:hypothetical protein IID62_03005, partial [candidate division KSB1 bacterium]|nr:hypothetical protein [candidate division KSB1 bacterium]